MFLHTRLPINFSFLLFSCMLTSLMSARTPTHSKSLNLRTTARGLHCIHGYLSLKLPKYPSYFPRTRSRLLITRLPPWMPLSPVPTEFQRPPPRNYIFPDFSAMPEGSISENEKRQLVNALQTHRINTIAELRRAEKNLATIDSADISEPMTSAWTYYVNYHGLLTELRSLTRNYPFSSDCVEEAKQRVYSDPNSNRSWNLAWLVLTKIQSDQLIPYYARYQASQPAMWGNESPSADGIAQLTGAFVNEWNYAVSQMLRYWDRAPVSH